MCRSSKPFDDGFVRGLLTVADTFMGGAVILIADFETILCQNGWFDAYSLDPLRPTAGLLSIRAKRCAIASHDREGTEPPG
jgi:hypothetical protein